MKYYFSESDEHRNFFEFFSFNQYPCEIVDLWNTSRNLYHIPEFLLNSHNSCLIVSFNDFFDFMQHNYANLVLFLHYNKIIVYQDIDSFVFLAARKKMHQSLLSIDSVVPANHVHFVLDGTPSDLFRINVFKNIKCTVLKYNHFLKLPRISGGRLEKNKNSKDFLLTSIKKPGRQHRQLLWKELQKHPHLMNNSLVFYKSRSNNWVGQVPHQHDFVEGYPSMDLYANSYIELVPETLYKNGFFITEKTIKPIATQTPFLMVSNCKYLQFLKQKGFKTFGSLISESYDTLPRIEDRVKALVATLSDIVSNGAEDFYHQAKYILDHNHRRLAEISGGWQYHRDLEYQQIIDNMV